MKRCTSIYRGHDEKTEDLGYPFYCHKQQSMIAIINENFKFFNPCALFTNEEEILAIKISTTPSLKNRLKNQNFGIINPLEFGKKWSNVELIFIIDKRMLILAHHHCHCTSNENMTRQIRSTNRNMTLKQLPN
jgi:hypothetical protein